MVTSLSAQLTGALNATSDIGGVLGSAASRSMRVARILNDHVAFDNAAGNHPLGFLRADNTGDNITVVDVTFEHTVIHDMPFANFRKANGDPHGSTVEETVAALNIVFNAPLFLVTESGDFLVDEAGNNLIGYAT